MMSDIADPPPNGDEEVEEVGTSAGGPDVDSSANDVMQALAAGDLPQQLAGMTSALQEQLLTITEEMNRLKSELYSEQGGLAAKLNDIAERATLETQKSGRAGSSSSAHAPTSSGESACSSCCNRRPGASASSSSSFQSHEGSATARYAPAPSSSARADGAERRQAGRHVDWAPGTRELTREQNMHERRRQAVMPMAFDHASHTMSPAICAKFLAHTVCSRLSSTHINDLPLCAACPEQQQQLDAVHRGLHTADDRPAAPTCVGAHETSVVKPQANALW